MRINFIFIKDVDYESECVGTAEVTNILYISFRFACTIKLNINENLQMWDLLKPSVEN